MNRFYHFDNCYFAGGNDTTLEYTIVLNYTSFVNFENCYFTGNYRGILFINENQYTKISSCVFQTPNVPIAAADSAVIKYLEVTDSSYDGAYPFIYFANLPATSQVGILILGNHIPNSNLDYINGLNTTIKGNIGYVTENSGSVVFDNTDSVTFEHGLAGKPTGVWVSFNNTNYGSWTWMANTTHITLNVTTPNYNGTAYWHAEYKP